MKNSLEVYHDNRLVYASLGHWLYPLFDLESFLIAQNLDPSLLFLKDKIIGRAAALIIVHLGFRTVYAALLSEPGKEILDRYGLNYEYGSMVDRVACKTEELLEGEYDPETAYVLIKERAQR